jgi:hypothetical protein
VRSLALAPIALVAAVVVLLALPGASGGAASASAGLVYTSVPVSQLAMDHFVDGDLGAKYLAGSFAGYVRSQDRFDLSLGNPDDGNTVTLDMSLVYAWLNILNTRFVSGPYATGGGEKIIHTSGWLNSAYAAKHAPAEIGAISEDWEPNFEPEFTFTFSKVLYWAEKLDAVAHAYHRQAYFFVTGRGLGQYSATWNYGLLATKLDHVTVQMQGNCLDQHTQVNMADGVKKLVAQFDQYHQSLSKLTVVVSIPDEYNAVSPSRADSCIQTALSYGIPDAEVYWTPSTLAGLYAELLKGLAR